jgi:hypothetical protein
MVPLEASQGIGGGCTSARTQVDNINLTDLAFAAGLRCRAHFTSNQLGNVLMLAAVQQQVVDATFQPLP